MSRFVSKVFFLAVCSIIFILGGINTTTAQENALKAETIHFKDGKYSYVVYLPPGYSTSKKWPVLFCFDALGDGELTAMIFSCAAINQGWIVVGSLDVKNGLSYQVISEIQDAMLNDILHRYSVDINQFYATGFSGGTYASYYIAYAYPDHFRGVIACGAGLGTDNVFARIVSSKISVFHCLGNNDFKYDEVVWAHHILIERGAHSKLRKYEGTHQYPPKEVILEALDWISKEGAVSR